MSTFLDNFTNTGGVSADLNTHTANSGETWAKHPTASGGTLGANGTNDRARAIGATPGLYKSTWVPGAADYDVTGTLVKVGAAAEGMMFVCGRMDATAATYYCMGHYFNGAAGQWSLLKYVNGVQTALQVLAVSLADGSSSTCKLEMRGPALKGYINGVETFSVTDSTITSAGLIGLFGFDGGSRMDADVMGAVDAGAAPATATTLTGPSSGTAGVASTNFTVGANGTITGTVIITPSDAANGGSFLPTTVSINTASPTGTFTYTPATTGVKTISTTNNGALTNPTALSYTSNAAGGSAVGAAALIYQQMIGQSNV